MDRTKTKTARCRHSSQDEEECTIEIGWRIHPTYLSLLLIAVACNAGPVPTQRPTPTLTPTSTAKPTPRVRPTSALRPTPTPVRPAWFPTSGGYSLAPHHDDVAFRWLEPDEFDCEDRTDVLSWSCYGLLLIARDGCPTRLEVTLGISWSPLGPSTAHEKGSVRAVEPLRPTRLVIESSPGDGDLALVEKVVCS
jgi:hypothetical protein